MTTDNPLGDISPYTYQNRHEQAREVLLIPVSADAVGRDNQYPPPQFDLENLASWMRQRYFLFEGKVIAQMPRKSGKFPIRCNDAQLTDVTRGEDAIYAYFPVTDEKAVCAWWEFRTDDWDIALVDQPSSDDGVYIDRGHAQGTHRAWSWRSRGANNDSPVGDGGAVSEP